VEHKTCVIGALQIEKDAFREDTKELSNWKTVHLK